VPLADNFNQLTTEILMRSKFLREKLMVVQLVKKPFSFYGSEKLTAMFITIYHEFS
jgi:hypothetical protein